MTLEHIALIVCIILLLLAGIYITVQARLIRELERYRDEVNNGVDSVKIEMLNEIISYCCQDHVQNYELANQCKKFIESIKKPKFPQTRTQSH